jgi:uncharacterized protein YqeY
MSVMARLEVDQVTARRSRDQQIVHLLDGVICECTNRSKNMRPVRALTDAEVLSVVNQQIKRRSAAILKSGKDVGQIRRLEKEREYLRRYLPPNELSDEDLEAIAVRLHSIMSMNQILDHLQSSYRGRYDPARAFDIVRGVVNS